MDLYTNFYESSFDENDSDAKNNKDKGNKTQLRHKAQNTFVYESLPTKLAKVKIRFNERIDNDYTETKFNEIQGEVSYSEKESNFRQILEREKILNNSSEYSIFYYTVNEYAISYVYVVNNYKAILTAIAKAIEVEISSCKIDPEAKYSPNWDEKKLKQLNNAYILALLDLIVGLIKDLREYCYEFFVDNNLGQIIQLINMSSKDSDMLDQLFSFFVNVFRLLRTSIAKNFKKMLVIYSELLFNKNKFIRKFAAQSLCFVIKNLEKEDLIETFQFLIDFIYHPEKLLDIGTVAPENKGDDVEMKDATKQSLSITDVVYQDKDMSKIIIYKALGGDSISYMKLFIIESLSELIKEILSNGSYLSQMSDLILAKLASNGIIKNDLETSLLFIQSFIKLTKRVKTDKSRYQVIALFHYFLIIQNDITANHAKLKLDTLVNQLIQIKSIDNNHYIRQYLLLFAKELLTKNFKIQDSSIGEYIQMIITRLSQSETNELELSLIIEITALMIKFYPKMSSSISYRKIFVKGREDKINFLLRLLIKLNQFSFYQTFSLYSNKQSERNDHDQYDIISYDKETSYSLFNHYLLNGISSLDYNTIVNIVTTYDRLFIADMESVEHLSLENEDNCSCIIGMIRSITIEDIHQLLSDFNVNSYSKVYVMLRLIKDIQIRSPNEYNKYLKPKVNQIASECLNQLSTVNFSNEEILSHILLYEFYNDDKFYLDKAQGYLTILLKSKEITNVEYPISNPQYSSYGLYIQLSQSITTQIPHDYRILLSGNNPFKKNYLKLYRKAYQIEQDKHKTVIEDIFDTMETILLIAFEFQNDKKYSINFEVLLSKMELLLSDGITKSKTDLVLFVFYFMMGSHWISLTKSVWVALAKGIERLFTFYVESPIQTNKEQTDIILFTHLITNVNELLQFAHKFPSESDFISKSSAVVKKNYIIFDSHTKNNGLIPLHVQNISFVLSELNSSEYKTISTFFNGISSSLSTSYNVILNYNLKYRDSFINQFIGICKIFSNRLDLYNPDKKYNESLSLFYNYILDKETKASSVHLKLKESLFSIVSKLTELTSYDNLKALQSIIFEQIILSKSTQIQHLAVEIIALYNSHIVPYKNLLSLVIDTSSFIIQLSNLAETQSDNGQIMKLEERTSLVPVLTRLHYSKYFSLSSEGGKLKTKHKINLVNYFIQLETNEFEDYINIIFEPLTDVLSKGIWYFDIRTYKKILEILKINLKQITSLFKGRIEKLAEIITTLFVFIKKFGERVKKNMMGVIEEISNEITNTDIVSSKYYVYYDQDELVTYTNFFLNNVKDLRKESFIVFEMIFHKFYPRTDLLKSISNEICREYNDNLAKQTSKINSIYKFFLSFSRHAKLHFVYRSNPLIMHSFMNLLSNPQTERRFLINIIEFVENLLSVYPDMESEMKIDDDNDDAGKKADKKRDENVIIEEMNLDSINDEENILDIKDDQPIDDMTMNENYKVIIKANFDLLNSSLVALISNDKIRPSIKDNITLRVIDILLTLWRLTQSHNLIIVNDILNFLLKIFNEDQKIFKDKEILNQVFHLCHILIIILIKGNTGDMTPIKELYQKFLSFLFKIENFNSRLLLCVILQEFGILNSNLANVLELITYLNKNKTTSRSMGVELDDVAVIEKLNVINEDFINDYFDNLEPLIYQLIILSTNEDFAIASLSLDKLFHIARCISQRNAYVQYTHVLNVMFTIIKTKFSYAKIIFETLSEMNSVNQSHLVCNDLYMIKPEIDPNDEDVNPLQKLNFLKMILNFKYDIRVEALKLLQKAITSGKITKESLNAIVIPIIRNFLNYKNYADNVKTNQKSMKRSNAVLTEITTEAIELVKILTPLINEEELKELLLFFFGNLQKLTKEKQKEVDYTIDIMKMTNRALTEYIECVIAVKFSKFDFVKNFNEITQTKINVKEDRNIRTIFYTIFSELKARNLASEYHNDQLYHILCKNIYPTLKGMLYDIKRKEGGKYYYIKNFIIQPFISIVKINSPFKSQNDTHQLSLELINNLANLDASIREKAREGIQHVLSSLGEYFSLMFFDDMNTHLHSGYQRHVLGYTVNYILQQVTSSEIYEICINTLVPILLDELFGDVAEEKEIDVLMSKYKEAKNIKGFNSFELISKHISLKTLMESVLMPLKNFLILRENTPSIVHRCNEVINAIVRGLKNNSHIALDDIIEYSYALIHICIEKNLQNAKAIKKLRNVEIKGNDIYSLSVSNEYSIEISNSFIKEKNNIIYSNLFAALGLELLQIAIKGRMIYLPKTDGNDKILIEGLNDKLTDVLTNVVICLKMSNNTILVSKAIKILISLFDCKLLIIKKNLIKITKALFKNLAIINPGDIPLTQAVLSGISDIFTRFSFVTVTNDKIKQLLDFLKLHINQTEIKPYVFSCILAIAKKKILHPSVYDIIEFIREIYLTSFEENTLTVTQGIIVEFLCNYPIEQKPLMAHLNYWIINLESNTRRCRFNAIKMLLFLIKKAYNELKFEELIDFLILKLFTLYSNCDDNELKSFIQEVLNDLFVKVPNGKFEQYYLNAIKLTSPDNNSNQSLKSFALCVLSLILNHKFPFFDMKSLDLILTNALQHELTNQAKELDEKITNNDFTTANEDTINVSSSQWSYLYQLIILIEKIQVTYDYISPKTIHLLLQAINHPHSFIKSIGLRLINNSITLVIKQADEDIIAGLMKQLKFIMMNNSFEEKVYNNAIGIIVAVSSSGLFIDSIKELINGISNDSKKWISNKDKDKGLAILQRVTTVYSQILSNTDEQKSKLGKIAKPMIDLCYRVGNNTLADAEIKTTCEIIMNEITMKMKKEDMTKIYKEVTSEISLLKKKRKMEQVDNFRAKHQK